MTDFEVIIIGLLIVIIYILKQKINFNHDIKTPASPLDRPSANLSGIPPPTLPIPSMTPYTGLGTGIWYHTIFTLLSKQSIIIFLYFGIFLYIS